jgi:proline dehydrogenase
MRRILLMMARSRRLKSLLPRLGFMRRGVRRFMPGETTADALAAARPLQAAGIGTIFTLLGENLERLADAEEVAARYAALIDEIAGADIDGEPSVKPTQLGLELDPEACFGHLERLADHAAARGSFLWIDMEGSSTVERTISLYERLRPGRPATGLCLQAYLHRTAEDIERLLPLEPAIRLVKGAYAEPRSIAWQDRRRVDASFLGLAVRFLVDGRGRPVRLGLGTHDVELVEQIDRQVRAAGIGRERFEVQMLYGIRSRELERLGRDGYRIRSLIAYGDAWYAWYMRRLAERPANVVFAVRSLLP